jgi:hypothetical protein
MENFKFDEENIKFYDVHISKKEANGAKTIYRHPESTDLILNKIEEISYILDNLGNRTFGFLTWLFAMQNFDPLITNYHFHHVELILFDSSPTAIKNIQNLVATNLTITSHCIDILKRKIEFPPMILQTQLLELNGCCFPFIIHQFASHISISGRTTNKSFEWLGSIKAI